MENITKEFKFGSPWRMSEDSLGVVIPVLRLDYKERGYVLADEAKDEISYEDSGDIDGVLVKNKHDKPVFLRGGNILKGKGTQSRATRYGIAIMPEIETEAEVKCVHSSHPISGGSSFESRGYYPDRNLRTSLMGGDQRRVWCMVNRASSRLRAASSPADDVEGELDNLVSNNLAEVKEAKESVSEFKKSVEEIIRKMPTYEDQVGMVVLDDRGISGVEVFDHPDSWNALIESVVEEYRDKITEKDEMGLFELREDRIDSLLSDFFGRIMNYERETVYESDGAKTVLIEGENIVGELTVMKGETIHILFVREEDKKGSSEEGQTVGISSGNELLPGDESNFFGGLHRAGSELKSIGNQGEKKGFKDILHQTKDGPKTWSEMDIDISSRTKSKRLKEAKSLGYIAEVKRGSNGKKAYSITPKGIQALDMDR